MKTASSQQAPFQSPLFFLPRLAPGGEREKEKLTFIAERCTPENLRQVTYEKHTVQKVENIKNNRIKIKKETKRKNRLDEKSACENHLPYISFSFGLFLFGEIVWISNQVLDKQEMEGLWTQGRKKGRGVMGGKGGGREGQMGGGENTR